MRKMILELIPNAKLIRSQMDNLFKKIDYMEALDVLRLDFEQGVKLVIVLYKVKEGFSLEDIDLPEGVEILNVLKMEEDKYTCLVKVNVPKQLMPLLEKFSLDLIWTAPMVVTENKLVYSAVGDTDNLKKFFEATKLMGTVQNVTYQKAIYEPKDLLSCLTDKQKEIVTEAKKSGYYEYPKKTNGNQLSKKLGISKAATIEHLRKAEGRIMANILAGY
ncbi:MAG: helix-turn-helix domain-containing protein [Halobacteriota archaeon]|nr:helix-turn-helix domain-containing protein [Halobacteriota archaeon]